MVFAFRIFPLDKITNRAILNWEDFNDIYSDTKG
jgi:hypothetical protein